MKKINDAPSARWLGACAVALLLSLGGCSGDDGDDGEDGLAGAPGADGVSCWDLNENGVADADEDINNDGVVDVLDCQQTPNIADAETLHAAYLDRKSVV